MPVTFADLGVPRDLEDVLARRGIDTPFPIQTAALPDALAGHDICGKAPTGSGKTIVFGIALASAAEKARPNRPRALVLVPTRELASQVRTELAPLAAARKRTVAVVYGGTGYGGQIKAMRQGADILVACPGRLEDLIERGDVDLGEVDLVVVDEADRMADMGFMPSVRRLLDATSDNRQTMLFSATLDGDVDKLVRRYQAHPKRHEVAAGPEDVGDVTHLFWRVERNERVAVVADVVSRVQSSVVFCRTRHGADRVARQLTNAGVTAAAIHGRRTQGQRERALGAFMKGRVRALVATDVAARGIHVDNVAAVIHFDPPADHKDYVHRSGRTGRAGADGTVVSLVLAEQMKQVRQVQRETALRGPIERPEIEAVPESQPIEHPKAATSGHWSNGTQRQGSQKSRRKRRGRGKGSGGSQRRSESATNRDSAERSDSGTKAAANGRPGPKRKRNKTKSSGTKSRKPRHHGNGSQGRRNGAASSQTKRRADSGAKKTA